MNRDTICVQGGYTPGNGEPRQIPIIQSTTFKYATSEDMGKLFDLEADGYFYSRLQNPTCDLVAKKICELEGGTAAMLTSSGQAANFFALFNLCEAGDHIVASSTIYGGTFNLISVTMKKMGIEATFVDPLCTEEELNAAFRPNTKALFEALALDEKAADTKHDMGGDIAPYFASRNEAGVYDFNSNEIPGSTATDHAYWRDVGTIKQFYDAHMDLIAYVPEFNLYNQDWPIYTMSGNLPPAKFVHAGRDRLGHATDSIVSPGVIVSGGEVHHSVLSPNVRIHSWAQIVDSVLFDGVVINRRARVYKAILDKNVVLTENSTVGIDTEHDLARGFTVTPDGITVVPKNTIVDD